LSAPQPGGRYVALGVTLRRLAGDAYGLDVLGGPAWVDSERFDVNAKAEGEPAPAQIRAMLRPLLADRFNLAVHTETREMPVYTLAVVRSDRRPGEKLRQSDPSAPPRRRNIFPERPAFRRRVVTFGWAGTSCSRAACPWMDSPNCSAEASVVLY
jgi:uncharacterized protein (TIGR03435 family)